MLRGVETRGWHVDFVASRAAIGGVVWLSSRARSTTVWLGVVRPGADPVVVIDDDAPPLASDSVELRAPGLWLDLVTEEPGARWSLGVEAFGVTTDAAAAPAVDPWGERTPLGLDLEWEAVGSVGEDAVACEVHGEVLVGREAIDLEGHGVVRNPGSVSAWGWTRADDGLWRAGSRSAAAPAGRLPFASAMPDGRERGVVAELVHGPDGGGWVVTPEA